MMLISASPMKNIKLLHPGVLLAPLAEGGEGLCTSGWAAKQKQQKKDKEVDGTNAIAFLFLHKCLHVNYCQ